MIFQTEISEDGEIIRISFTEMEEEVFASDFAVEEIRDIIRVLSDSVLKAITLDEFTSNKRRNNN